MVSRDADSFDVLLACIKQADGWVVRNLRRNGNSVFPSEYVTEDHDRVLGEKLLTCILHERVSIRETDGGYICAVNGR